MDTVEVIGQNDISFSISSNNLHIFREAGCKIILRMVIVFTEYINKEYTTEISIMQNTMNMEVSKGQCSNVQNFVKLKTSKRSSCSQRVHAVSTCILIVAGNKYR